MPTMQQFRFYFRMLVGLIMFTLAVYRLAFLGSSVADVQVLLSGVLGLYFVIDGALLARTDNTLDGGGGSSGQSLQ